MNTPQQHSMCGVLPTLLGSRGGKVLWWLGSIKNTVWWVLLPTTRCDILLLALDDFFDGFDESVAIVGGVVGLDCYPQKGMTVPLHDRDLDLEFVP